MARLPSRAMGIVSMDATSLGEVEKVLGELKQQVYDARKKSAVKAAQPIVKRATELAPDSKSNITAGGRADGPTRDKWGKKYRNNPKWTGISIKHHVGEKAIVGKIQDLLIVGLKYPKGNKGNFNYTVNKEGREEVFWGRRNGTLWKPVYRFMDKALDEKKKEVVDIFVAEMKKAIESG